MTGERKILTLKRQSPPEGQDKTREISVRSTRKKMMVEATLHRRKKKKNTAPEPETAVQPPVPQNTQPELRGREPKRVRPPKPPRTLAYHEAASLMQGYWPDIFDGQQPRLFKLHIREDLYQDIEQRELPLSRKVLRRCLKSITRSADYLSQIQTDAPRYNLKGIVEGHVNEQEYQFAIEKLKTVATSVS
ncbi:ProQ/FINO family protein [Yersinia enterocolitica]|uniref:ProQ/FINO family protein n=1 Tax=Yersinia enterocolitica TaxID=630 RepID=UPI003D7AA85A